MNRFPDWRKKKNRIWKFLLFAVVLLALGTVTAATIVSTSIKGFDVDQLKKLLVETPKDKARETIKIFDSSDNLISEFDSGENREYVPLKNIKKITQESFICAEDERFYLHKGYDIRSILRAFYRNLVSGEMSEGGSTITQQLARNVYLNSFEKTASRKIKEILLSIEIEKTFTKKDILEFYLNQVYFGSGAYGIESASKKYFGKSASKLDLAESTMLAGILTSPSTINPYSDFPKARAAQRSVLVKMVDNGYILHWQMDQAYSKKLVFKPFAVKNEATSINYFIDYVKDEIALTVGQNVYLRGGLNVTTTVDVKTQEAAQEAVNVVLDKAEKNGDFGKVVVDQFGARQPQSALVAIDVKTGWIRAMVGGRDYKTTQYNRTLSLRAPGSTFKVFVYSTAFEMGRLSPFSLIRSSPISYGGWNPTEWFRGYFGTVSVQYAIQESSNICAIRALLDVGMKNVAQKAKEMAGIGEIPSIGDREILAVPSMALGTVEMRPVEMASAGQTIANLGKHKRPVSILKIVNRKTDSVIYNPDESEGATKQVLSETTAYDMISCLKRVVLYGTGKNANVPGVPCAGKTGTTTNFRDGWFLGFTPKISASVYVGADSLDTDLSFVQNYGSTYSAVIWKEFIKRVPHAGVKDWVEPDPGSWMSVQVCSETGLLPNKTCKAISRLCRKGYAPTGVCTVNHEQWVDVTICKDTGKIANIDFCPHQAIVRYKLSERPTQYCQLHLKKPEKPITKTDETKPAKKTDDTKKSETGNNQTKEPETKQPDNKQPTQNPKPDPTPKPDPKPNPKPDPEPKPNPEPEPQPQPEPEPEPEPQPEPPKEEYKYFTIDGPASARVGETVSFAFRHNYANAARVEMYVNSVFVGGGYPDGSIYWKPGSATTYSITFYLRDSAGTILDSRTIQFTVFP